VFRWRVFKEDGGRCGEVSILHCVFVRLRKQRRKKHI